jgi:hypothetical protein
LVESIELQGEEHGTLGTPRAASQGKDGYVWGLAPFRYTLLHTWFIIRHSVIGTNICTPCYLSL